MIFKEYTVTVKGDVATINEPVYLYKYDKNVELRFNVGSAGYKYTRSDTDNLVIQSGASYCQVRFMNTESHLKYTFDICPTVDGQAVLLIKGELIDEDVELGIYDFQIRLLDKNKNSVASLPPIKGAIHIDKPLFDDEEATVDYSVTDLDAVAEAETSLDTYNTDGTYNQTNWAKGDIISSAKLNKLEQVSKDNVDKIKGLEARKLTIQDNSITPNKTTFLKAKKNLLIGEWTLGNYVNWQTGELIQDVGFNVSDYAEVTEGTRISYSCHNALAFYDANHAFIAGINGTGTKSKNYTLVDGEIEGQRLHGTYTVPEGAHYVRVSFNVKDKTPQLELGEESTEYEKPYYMIDDFYYPDNADSGQSLDKLVKKGEICTITTQKAKYIFKRVTDTSINVDAWRLYSGDLVDKNGVTYNMWKNSDAEGAIKIVGEDDFVCGYHGDEIYTDITFLVDGVVLDTTHDYDGEFEDLTIISTSKVYHCNTSANAKTQAFKRIKKLRFNGDKVTISNRFECLDDLTISRAAIALFQCYKTVNEGTTLLTKVSTNDDLVLYDVNDTTITYPLSKNITQASFYTNLGVIDVKVQKGTNHEKYMGYIAPFHSQNRMKVYFDYIKGDTKVTVGEILQSKFEFSINDLSSEGQQGELSNYAKKVDIPTKTSQLTNDSSYITQSEVDLSELDSLTNNIVVDETLDYSDLAIGGENGTGDANKVNLTDIGNYFTSENVEGALQEAGEQIKDIANKNSNPMPKTLAKLKTNQDTLIMFAGDSITEATQNTNTMETSYVACICRYLKELYPNSKIVRVDGKRTHGGNKPLETFEEVIVNNPTSPLNVITVVKSGVGGDTLLRLQKRMNDFIQYKGMTPDVIFLMEGINDSLTDDQTKYIPIDLYEKYYRTLIQYLKRETTSEIVLMTSHWHGDTPTNQYPVKKDYNLNHYINVQKKVAIMENLYIIDHKKVWDKHFIMTPYVNWGQGEWLTKEDATHPTPTGQEFGLAKTIWNEVFINNQLIENRQESYSYKLLKYDNPILKWNGTWNLQTTTSTDGNMTFKQKISSGTVGDNLKFKLKAKEINLLTKTGKAMGSADIYINGEKVKSINNNTDYPIGNGTSDVAILGCFYNREDIIKTSKDDFLEVEIRVTDGHFVIYGIEYIGKEEQNDILAGKVTLTGNGTDNYVSTSFTLKDDGDYILVACSSTLNYKTAVIKNRSNSFTVFVRKYDESVLQTSDKVDIFYIATKN